MSDRSKIEWTDASWNPTTGCDKVSPGCDHCYALTLAERFRGTPGHYYENGFDVQLRPDKLDQPFRWRKPRRVFVNSMSDLFHADIPDEYIARVFAVMALAPQHTFQVLTKRHGRMHSLLSSTKFEDHFDRALHDILSTYGGPGSIPATWEHLCDGPLPNVWLGVSVEDQKRADLRIPALLDTPAAVRFVSAEPLLGPITTDLTGIDWVIVGGESGRGARPMHIEWARSLRDQCQAAGVPYFFKQWGEWAPVDQAIRYNPPSTGRRSSTGKTPSGGHHTAYLDREGGSRTTNDLTTFTIPSDWVRVARVGKTNAGRELDGRTWDEYPSTRP